MVCYKELSREANPTAHAVIRNNLYYSKKLLIEITIDWPIQTGNWHLLQMLKSNKTGWYVCCFNVSGSESIKRRIDKWASSVINAVSACVHKQLHTSVSTPVSKNNTYLHLATNWWWYLPRNAMLSMVYAAVVCLSHSDIVSKSLNVGSRK